MKVLVTGGGGFIGGWIVDQLLVRGYRVRSFGRSPQHGLKAKKVEVFRGDLACPKDVRAACRGMETVFHVAAKAGIQGDRNSFYRPNVLGTRNILEACRAEGVRHLVYTSTPSVVFNGKSIRNGDSGMPYGRNWLCHYAHTKAIAEREVLAAHSEKLRIIALRPHLVFGPGDPHLLPRVIESVKAGRLKIIGKGVNRVDVSYVENVATAHLNALDALLEGRGAGKAYFISQGRPVELWPWLNRILEALGYAPLKRRIPLPVAYLAGAVAECIWNVFSKSGEPPITRFVAVELAKDHYFNIKEAYRDLNYTPAVTMEVALERSIRDLKKRGF